MIKAVSEELTLVEQKRVEIVKKYGVTDDKGNTQVQPDKMELFQKDLNDILNTEIDFVDGLTAKALDNPNVNLSTQDYYLIEKFISE